ncbi:MAG: hypothetical protein KKB74_05805 [Bacteroidetes bacterium]|nr:hypothetical protein [Bacteroidota bacterium]
MSITNLKFIFFVSTVLLLSGTTYSQTVQATTEKPALNNNAFHGSVSPSIIYLAASIYYERIVYKSEKMAYFAKAGYGAYTIIMSGTGDFIVAQGGIITGANKSHFEAGLGATYLSTVDDSHTRKVLPAAYAGYRRQKPGGHGVFRAGFGFPEFLFVSWGFSF